MTTLTTGFQKYRWLLLLAAGIGGALAGQNVLNALPPGTDLASAILAIYALNRQDRDKAAERTAELLATKHASLVEIVAANKKQCDSTAADVAELQGVANNHADAIESLHVWEQPRGYAPATALLRSVRPATALK